MIDSRRRAADASQAAIGDGHSLDALEFSKNGFAAPETDISRRQILQAFVGAGLGVVGNEGFDALLKLTWQFGVLKKDAVLLGLMPALDLSLGLRVKRRAANVVNVRLVEPFGEVTADLAGSVVGQSSRSGELWRLIDPRKGERLSKRCGDIIGVHSWRQSPRGDEARIVIEGASWCAIGSSTNGEPTDRTSPSQRS